jgi:hypothetical protein
MPAHRWTTFALSVVVFCAASVFGFFTAPAATAHEYSVPFRWYRSNANFTNLGSVWGPEIRSAAEDYNATDLTTTYSSSGVCSSACIYFQSLDLGPQLLARARPYYNGNPCFDEQSFLRPGVCNTTDRRPNLGYVDFNSRFSVEITDKAKFLARHETGHVFGMNGTFNCGDVTVMNETPCGYKYSWLQAHDIGHINAWY